MNERLEGPLRGPMLSRWSAILCGAAVALGVFLVAMTVWLVFAAAGYAFFVRDLDWFILGTALFSALVAGYVAGYVEDWRSARIGVWNGLASWGLIIVLGSMFVLPNFLRPLTHSHDAGAFVRGLDYQMMVVTCCAFGGGLVLAACAASVAAQARRSGPVTGVVPEIERQLLEDVGVGSGGYRAVFVAKET